MKGISLYLVTYNEAKDIAKTLNSILNQTKKPNEIIIVDGKSTDGTIDIIKSYIKKNKNIKLIIKKSNIPQARNIARKAAKYDYIISTDADNIVPKNWVEKLTKPLDKYDLTYGAYEPYCESLFNECSAPYMFKSKKILEKGNFLPTNKNLAYKKEVWEKVGLPENLERGEDTYFSIMAKRKGFKFKFVPGINVKWKPRDNLKQVFKLNYGDAKANTENLEIMTYPPIGLKIIILYLGIIIYLLSLIFISWKLLLIPPIFISLDFLRKLLNTKKIKKAYLLEIIMITTRFSQTLGTIMGTLYFIKRRILNDYKNSLE